MENKITHTQFKFKGTRNYIQGPDIFNEFLKQIGNDAIKNISFSVHGFIHNRSCDVFFAENKQSLETMASNFEARFRADCDSETKWLAIKPREGETLPDLRSDYDEEKIISLCELGDETILLQRLSPYSFIETIVSMNKRLLQQLYPDIEGKWVFTRIDLSHLPKQIRSLSIRFRHNMNFRLLKSDIVVNEEKVGDLFFSLVKI